jgi:hypothetical protein
MGWDFGRRDMVPQGWRHHPGATRLRGKDQGGGTKKRFVPANAGSASDVNDLDRLCETISSLG